ncbi:MAG: hypothetical protein E7373_01745 [Clostridiales bacterium]|nr:hypothetical protein [Clostridiales bacterium]
MNNKEEFEARKLLLRIIKNIINPKDELLSKIEISNEVQIALYKIASRQDLAHLVGFECNKLGIITNKNISDLFKKQQIMSVYRYERINYDYQEIKTTLSNEKIPFVPLKGAVIREYYPEPWMRTSCDVDVLVKKEDLEKAVCALKKSNKFVQKGKINYHDVSLFSPSQVHLELHFNIKENIDYIDKLLEKVWDYCQSTKENCYEYKQSNEFFYFHIISHILYHFKSGGCGVRPFIDLFLLHKSFAFDQEKLNLMLTECGISTFYEQIMNLLDVWFNDKEHTELTLSMEDFIFTGGVYGSKENQLATKKKTINKKKYILNRIFSPYDVIKNRYPILQKHKWLTPFYQVRRWFESLFSKKVYELKKDIEIYNNIDDKTTEKIDKMFNELGIKI